jgi:Concanavalin A-like lectin/glucanases superfamily
MSTSDDPTRPVLRAHWRFEEGAGPTVADASGNGNTLIATGNAKWTDGPAGAGAMAFADAACWLSTEGPALRTDESFSVAAWLRLDSAPLGGVVDLPAGSYAVTACSQDGDTHSALFLGARKVMEGQTAGVPEAPLRWDFTVSPRDGSTTGLIEWPHAHAAPLTAADLDRWVFLAGVYDLAAGTATLLLPETGDSVPRSLPDGWTNWSAEGGFVVGRARYLSAPSDPWPGSVGPVWVFSGLLSADDAAALHRDGVISG